MRTDELHNWLEHIETLSKTSDIIIVPGGGEFANKVRALQSSFKFNEQLAHQMALLAMCQFGYLLSGLGSKIEIVDDMDGIYNNLGKPLPLLWLPLSLLNDFTQVPTSWDYSSDSIALWLAKKLIATRLILVKSRFIANPDSGLEKMLDKGYLDKGFQWLRGYYAGEVVWFEKSQYGQLAPIFCSGITPANYLIS